MSFRLNQHELSLLGNDDELVETRLVVKQMKQRIPAALLALSASALVGLAVSEGYTPVAVIPTVGDRPTVGFGSTFREDGSPVRMGDTITPQKALGRSLAHIAKDESVLKGCITAPLHQAEYDLLVDFSYQYGAVTACKSSIVGLVNQGRYAEACNAYLKYRFAAGYDCSTPGNKRCMGVWTRQLERQKTCLGAQ